MKAAPSCPWCFVAGGLTQRGHLDKIEIIEQADPHNAGQHMNPDYQGTGTGYRVIPGHDDQDDSQYETGRNRAANAF
jgi:hypothetical protein